jgi:hypothetical protein
MMVAKKRKRGARRMEFLIHLNAKKGAKAHIWTGDDTACRAWSLSMKHSPRYRLFDSAMGCDICMPCRSEALPLILNGVLQVEPHEAELIRQDLPEMLAERAARILAQRTEGEPLN